MPETITITRAQYEAEITEAYANGRADERKHQRDKVTETLTSNRHDTVVRYFKAMGWKMIAVKPNGTEWLDPPGSFRVGLPSKITTRSWATLLRGMAEYYHKSMQAVQADILAGGGK